MTGAYAHRRRLHTFTRPWVLAALGVAALAMAIVASPAYAATGTVTASTPGATTYTVPPGVTSVTVEAWGGGGGGGGGDGDDAGGGGGGGGYARSVVAVTPGQVYNVVVGQGGTSGTASGGDGGLGGGSSFAGNGVTLSTTGGFGGIGGDTTGAGGNPGSGATGGVGLTGPSSQSGGAGGDGEGDASDAVGGGGGGGAAGANGAVADAGATGEDGNDTGEDGDGGPGGGSPPSLGGSGGDGGMHDSDAEGGETGTLPGGGGGGGGNDDTAEGAGGAGANGRVLIHWTTLVPSTITSTIVATPTTLDADGVAETEIVVTVKDSPGGANVQGALVTLAASPNTGVVIDPNTGVFTNSSGVATFSATRNQAGVVAFTATIATEGNPPIQETVNVTFEAAGPAGCTSPDVDHATFAPAVHPTGVSISIWGGGNVNQMGTAISFWTTSQGSFVGYIPGAPAFVNQTFLQRFPNGEVPPCQGIIVRKS